MLGCRFQIFIRNHRNGHTKKKTTNKLVNIHVVSLKLGMKVGVVGLVPEAAPPIYSQIPFIMTGLKDTAEILKAIKVFLFKGARNPKKKLCLK